MTDSILSRWLLSCCAFHLTFEDKFIKSGRCLASRLAQSEACGGEI
ncbi:unnamed protein product [Brassica oleracea var. botrytis]